MIDEKTGGYAFPAIGESNTPGGTRYVFNEGMTMLDHFAGLAMQAQLEALQRLCGYTPHEWSETEAGADHAQSVAADSYRYAAAMIAERNRLMNEKP
jgi:hypothetical protein